MVRFLKILLLSCLFYFSNLFYAYTNNNELDSLKTVLQNKSLNDSIIVNTCLQLADYYKYEQSDSAWFYFQKAYTVAQSSKKDASIILCLRSMGNFQIIQGKYDIATKLFLHSIEISNKMGDKNAMALGYNGLGIVYFYSGMPDKAMQCFFNALKIHENLKNKREIATNLNSIGNVYYYQNNFDKALEYYEKSKKIIETLDDLQGLSSSINNIGLVKIDLKAYDDAIALFKQSLLIDESLGDKRGKSTCLANIGLAFLKQGLNEKDEVVASKKFIAALPYFMQSLELDIEIGDLEGQANVYGNLAELHYKLKNYGKAKDFGFKSLNIAKEIDALSTEKDVSRVISAAFEEQKSFEKALYYFKLYKSLNDSLFNLENNELMKEVETKYQTKKQQIEIENLTKDQALKDARITLNNKQIELQRIILILTISGLVLLILSIIMLFRLYKQKNAAYDVLTQRNEEINQMNEEIMTQRDHLQILNSELSQKNEEISAQRDEIEGQRNEIEKQNEILSSANKTIELRNKNILDSMRYAQHIQGTILPEMQTYAHYFNELFVLFLPKDIVSGDFYWFSKKGEKIYFAVVDCTGHGIPGAFMSFLSHHILDAALKEQNIDKPSEILDYVNKEIFNTFTRSGNEKEVREGMDLVLCSYDINNRNLQWAAARNSLFIKAAENLTEYKGDKLAIGRKYHTEYQVYTNHEKVLNEGDIIYLTTDGLLDQFDVTGQKKFSKERFLKLIRPAVHGKLQYQKENIEHELNLWRGNYEQIDDILLLALKIQ